MSKLLPSKLKRKAQVIVRETSASVVLDDALSILNNEIQRFRVKSNSGFSLEAEEAKVLRTYIQSLVELSREQREQEKHDGLSETLDGMTDAELLELYRTKQLGSVKE